DLRLDRPPAVADLMGGAPACIVAPSAPIETVDVALICKLGIPGQGEVDENIRGVHQIIIDRSVSRGSGTCRRVYRGHRRGAALGLVLGDNANGGARLAVHVKGGVGVASLRAEQVEAQVPCD